MTESIDPVNAEMKLSQLLGEDFLTEAPAASARPAAVETTQGVKFSGNPFEDLLTKAINALEGVSRSETYANQLIDKYMRGEVELHEVMVAQAKSSILVQLAVTTINSAVTTFKEITQMQV